MLSLGPSALIFRDESFLITDEKSPIEVEMDQGQDPCRDIGPAQTAIRQIVM